MMAKELSNASLFGIGAAIGGVVGLGLSLYANYVLLPNLFATAPTQPSPANPQITNPTPTAPTEGT
jgi:hypothetical protein